MNDIGIRGTAFSMQITMFYGLYQILYRPV